jgi:hypothetical protein
MTGRNLNCSNKFTDVFNQPQSSHLPTPLHLHLTNKAYKFRAFRRPSNSCICFRHYKIITDNWFITTAFSWKYFLTNRRNFQLPESMFSPFCFCSSGWCDILSLQKCFPVNSGNPLCLHFQRINFSCPRSCPRRMYENYLYISRMK